MSEEKPPTKFLLDFKGCTDIYVIFQTRIVLKDRKKGEKVEITISSDKIANIARRAIEQEGHKVTEQKEVGESVVLEVEVQ